MPNVPNAWTPAFLQWTACCELIPLANAPGIASLTWRQLPADDPKCQSAEPASIVRTVAARTQLPGLGTAVALRRTAPQLMASRMQHQKTVRGHRYPVYCLAFDRTGRLLITGSDDRNVKVTLPQMACCAMHAVFHVNKVRSSTVEVCKTKKQGQARSGSGCDRRWLHPFPGLRPWGISRRWRVAECRSGVQMWSMQTGLLRMTCRGHEGEVTDLAVSADNAMAASSSNDASIRVWGLQEGGLGQAVSVLLGHGAPVTFVDFHRAVPEVLLSSSMDGSCRLWDARAGGAALHQLNAGPQFSMELATLEASAAATEPVAPGSPGPAAGAGPPAAAEAGTQAAGAAEHVSPLRFCSIKLHVLAATGGFPPPLGTAWQCRMLLWCDH